MRIAYWNILQGGGRRRARIVDALLSHEPDVALIGEFRSTTGPGLLAALAQRGLGHQIHTKPMGIAYGQAAASRAVMSDGPPLPDGDLAARRLEITAEQIGILSVNIPSGSEQPLKEPSGTSAPAPHTSTKGGRS